MKIKSTQELSNAAKNVYLKPTMHVYETEVEAAIMDGASGSSRDFETWGKADINGFENPIDQKITA